VTGVTEAALARDAADRRERLASALSLAAARGYVLPLIQGGAPVRTLLEAGLKHPLPPEAQAFVRDRVLPLMPQDSGRTAALPSGEEDWDLTEKEREVLALLSQGLTNADMASELFVSVNTVKTHLKRIFAKLGVETRTEAVQRGRRLGLIPSDRP
jgi:LuxR family maltose regulon positive regulatory protein